ncbi:MAG: hypothetical protein KJO33_04855 [Gammaproteobacteria bacterium]|nr:hypothetical protein [Gammaproteobacteria bacterium]
MNPKSHILSATCILFACLAVSGNTLARPDGDACIELGALAYNDWTHPAAGGSGRPAGESNVEYLRCKSCHGWDRLGLNGGYVRRERTSDQPNAGLGDLNTVSRDIAPGLGNYYEIDTEDILHEGEGRSYEDGSASWVPLDSNPAPENIAAHMEGYSLGNLHPDFSASGVNGGDILLTQDQLECLVEFINFADADPKFYFQSIFEDSNPVEYVINSGASATAGRTFYETNCLRCHGEPATNANGALPEGGFVSYLRQDGAYSEFVHHARWGIPGTIMTRSALGSPGSQNMIDLMLYLQQIPGDDFLVSAGISGSWWNPDRSGEGFQVDIGAGGIVVVAMYTYDTLGNQMWLWGSGTFFEDRIVVDAYLTDGAMYGEAFDPLAVNRYHWGTLTLVFETCYRGRAELLPRPEYALEFEAMTIPLTRLIDPIACEGGQTTSIE